MTKARNLVRVCSIMIFKFILYTFAGTKLLNANMKYLFVIFCLIASKFTNGQQITTVFDHTVIEENFESINKTWPQIFNTENIALSQPGHYEMRRINNESGNYIFPSVDNEPKAYEVLLNLAFTKNNQKNSTAGILLNSNQENGTGILFELRNDRSYRISNISENGTTYYTNAQEDGWVKDKPKVAKKNNIIRILTHRKKYDVYFNDNFIYTFTELSNEGGKIGLYIGPNSHAYYYSFVLKVKSQQLLNDNPEKMDGSNEKMMQDLVTKIKLQQNEIDRLKGMRLNDSKNIAENKALQNTNDQLQGNINGLNQIIDSLNKDNSSLNYFKNSIVNAPEGETILALSKMVQILRTDKIELTRQLDSSKLIHEQDKINLSAELNNNKELQQKINQLNNQIQFLIRQMDWMNKKLKSDSTHIIDTLRIKGQGFILPQTPMNKHQPLHLKIWDNLPEIKQG